MDKDPRPTDLDEKLMAFRRRTAGPIRSRERSQQSPPSNKRTSSNQPRTLGADHEDFSRRLKISNSPAQPKQASSSSKLFNPDTDPIPARRATESALIANGATDRGTGAQRQLFDHRKDDPVKFSALARPQSRTPKSNGDYVSASSTSSYTPSIASSITLSSTTSSSLSSALFDGHSQVHEQSSDNALSTQLKLLYREITALENRIKQEDAQDDADELLEGRVLIRGRDPENNELEKEKWKRRVADHKKLADIIHELLVISLAPSVPASLRQIPTKYNIIVRLWTFAFHRLLESLRRASFASPVALEHLQDFICYSYTFYTSLLEDETLSSFKNGWLEALGDLARYRMAVAAMITGGVGGGNSVQLTAQAIRDAAISGAAESPQSRDSLPPATTAAADANAATSTDIKAKIDDSPSPSIGIAAARLLEVEPEKELWRSIAREWYATGLSEQPGTGKLHHHLGLLSREVEGEELRAVYHFVKSMTALHPFPTARESVLPLWSGPAQARRFLPDASVSDLFVLLHGMLFTNIQLDDFDPVLSRFIERLELDGAEERQWIMMAVVNVSAIFEYGRPGGILRRASGIATREGEAMGTQTALKVVTKKTTTAADTFASQADKMDIDEDQRGDSQVKQIPRSIVSHISRPASGDFHHADLPMPFLLALHLTFSTLTHVLHRPFLKSSAFVQSDINPYLTVTLTFLLTMMKHPTALRILEHAVPWEKLASFLTTIPKQYMRKQGVLNNAHLPSSIPLEKGKWAMLTNGCTPPLPEDWCMRGMEWVGRRVFERGYWRAESISEDCRSEIDVLAKGDHIETTDGQIEDDDSEQVLSHVDGQRRHTQHKCAMSQAERRWVRVLRCGIGISEVVDGFSWTTGTKTWKVEGDLLEKVKRWKELEQEAKAQEEERLRGRRSTDETMDIDEDETVESEESEDDENDPEEMKALKARRRYLRGLLQSAQNDGKSSNSIPRRLRLRERKTCHQSLCMVPGYTVLVIDTNILLSFLSIFMSLVESFRWTIVVPVPVMMELDGLAMNSSALGDAAQNAIAYISSHIRTHGLSLKFDFADGDGRGDWERNMDDLILKAAIWQDEHWVNRSSLLEQKSEANPPDAAKVVLLSLDRNLRLKARSRQLLAASEKDLASILADVYPFFSERQDMDGWPFEEDAYCLRSTLDVIELEAGRLESQPTLCGTAALCGVSVMARLSVGCTPLLLPAVRRSFTLDHKGYSQTHPLSFARTILPAYANRYPYPVP